MDFYNDKGIVDPFLMKWQSTEGINCQEYHEQQQKLGLSAMSYI